MCTKKGKHENLSRPTEYSKTATNATHPSDHTNERKALNTKIQIPGAGESEDIDVGSAGDQTGAVSILSSSIAQNCTSLYGYIILLIDLIINHSTCSLFSSIIYTTVVSLFCARNVWWWWWKWCRVEYDWAWQGVYVFVSNITQLAIWYIKTNIALVRPKAGMEQKLLVASARLAG